MTNAISLEQIGSGTVTIEQILNWVDGPYFRHFYSESLAKGLEGDAALLDTCKGIQAHSRKLSMMRRDPQTRKAMVKMVAERVYNEVRMNG